MILLSVSRSPMFLKHDVSQLLSLCLINPHGFHTVLRSMFEGKEGFEIFILKLNLILFSNFLDSVQVYEFCIKLMTNIPKNFEKKDYFEKLAPQILESLKIRDVRHENIHKVTTLVIGRMFQKYPKYAQKYIISPITIPFHLFLKENQRFFLLCFKIINVLFSKISSQ